MLTTRSRSLARASALTRFLLCIGLSVCSLSPSRSVAQDKGVVAAASAFTQAQQAELSGDHARAAELFELADRIAPTPEALRSATRARLAAGPLVAAADNAEELLRRYPNDEAARELADKALAEARPALMRLTLQCSEPCTVIVDGLAAALSALNTQVVYLTPGAHQLTLGFEQGLERSLRLSGAAGESRTLRVARPSPSKLAAPSAPTESPAATAGTSVATTSAASGQRDADPTRGLRPAYFWVAAGLTVVTGGVALWSGLDLLESRDDFEADATPTRAQFEEGEKKDLRTTVLLGATGALLVGTATLAAFTKFRSNKRASASLQLGPQGAGLSYRSSF